MRGHAFFPNTFLDFLNHSVIPCPGFEEKEVPLPSLFFTVEFRCPVFCGHKASTRSSYKISSVGSSRAHCSPRGVPGRCGWDERALRVSGGLPGLEGGGRDANAPITTLTAGVAAVLGALRVASSLPARRPSSGATPRRDPILRSAAGRSTTPASSTPPTSTPICPQCVQSAPKDAVWDARGRRMLRSCAWLLRLRSQTGSCCSRIRYPLVFSGPLHLSNPKPFWSLSFPYLPLAFPLLSSFLFLILLFYFCTF